MKEIVLKDNNESKVLDIVEKSLSVVAGVTISVALPIIIVKYGAAFCPYHGIAAINHVKKVIGVGSMPRGEMILSAVSFGAGIKTYDWTYNHLKKVEHYFEQKKK